MNHHNEAKLSRHCREIIHDREERIARTDLGIAILHAISKPAQRWTLDEIALFAGTTESAILLIERKALRKIRNRFSNQAFFEELRKQMAA